jgi:hypothetical protein
MWVSAGSVVKSSPVSDNEDGNTRGWDADAIFARYLETKKVSLELHLCAARLPPDDVQDRSGRNIRFLWNGAVSECLTRVYLVFI